jgi:hypothetical protein
MGLLYGDNMVIEEATGIGKYTFCRTVPDIALLPNFQPPDHLFTLQQENKLT